VLDDTYGFEKGCRYYENCSPTLRSERIGLKVMSDTYRIRKLTPKECWRLMGFSDEDFDKAKWHTEEYSKEFLKEHKNHIGRREMSEDGRIERMSNSQLYKQAGNSIVVDVPYHIYCALYNAMPYLFDNLKVGSYFSGIGAFEKALDRFYADKYQKATA
jgi:DNA (cytosine-5)-methyltransferase 1